MSTEAIKLQCVLLCLTYDKAYFINKARACFALSPSPKHRVSFHASTLALEGLLCCFCYFFMLRQIGKTPYAK